MERYYDVIIGTGTAGRTLADKVARSGLKIAIIDSREYGGTCPLRGCDPKKVLADTAELTDWNNRLMGKGSGTQYPLKIDWHLLIDFKRTFTEEYPGKTEKYFAEMGIDTYHGRAHFENQNTIVVREDKLRNDETIISSISVTDIFFDVYLGKWNYRAIPKVKTWSYFLTIP